MTGPTLALKGWGIRDTTRVLSVAVAPVTTMIKKDAAAKNPICFSKSEFMHETVIGLFINQFEFTRNV